MQVLKWMEPTAFKRAMRGSGPRWWVRVVVSLTVAAIILIVRAVTNAPNAPGWSESVLVVFGLGFVLGLGIPALTSLVPPEVIIQPKGILRASVNGYWFRLEFWPWHRIAAYSVEARTLDESFDVSMLQNGDQEKIGEIGIARRVPLADLEAYFAEHGTNLEKRAG
jgi:hypothetical protein